MSKLEVLELLQQDIEDIKALVNYDKYDMSKENMQRQSRGILLNLQEHLEELIENY